MLDGLGCFLFARHYSGNHYCFLFHQVLRCFSSPGCLQMHPMYSDADVTTLLVTGCPIRRSPGLRLFPPIRRLIAGSRVLHRLLVPRHPPYALSNLTKKFYSQIFCLVIAFKKLFLYGSVKH
jgi:hypothetical protein